MAPRMTTRAWSETCWHSQVPSSLGATLCSSSASFLTRPSSTCLCSSASSGSSTACSASPSSPSSTSLAGSASNPLLSASSASSPSMASSAPCSRTCSGRRLSSSPRPSQSTSGCLSPSLSPSSPTSSRPGLRSRQYDGSTCWAQRWCCSRSSASTAAMWRRRTRGPWRWTARGTRSPALARLTTQTTWVTSRTHEPAAPRCLCAKQNKT
mmetsp:Transcript_1461/g.3265  ORF Transcript_1461/g.3265 Transcript_1461/m.3265 type:complete len:210 (-) Transcript_1461:7-636(-)